MPAVSPDVWSSLASTLHKKKLFYRARPSVVHTLFGLRHKVLICCVTEADVHVIAKAHFNRKIIFELEAFSLPRGSLWRPS